MTAFDDMPDLKLSMFTYVYYRKRDKSVISNLTNLNLKYSGLNLNQDKATKPQTVQIVRQGEATPYQFKVNPL